MFNAKIHFGKLLLDLRKKMGVSQKEVADNCGLERAYISRLERGISEPSISTLFKLSDYFEVQAGEIVSLIDKQRKRGK